MASPAAASASALQALQAEVAAAGEAVRLLKDAGAAADRAALDGAVARLKELKLRLEADVKARPVWAERTQQQQQPASAAAVLLTSPLARSRRRRRRRRARRRARPSAPLCGGGRLCARSRSRPQPRLLTPFPAPSPREAFRSKLATLLEHRLFYIPSFKIYGA